MRWRILLARVAVLAVGVMALAGLACAWVVAQLLG